MKRRLLKVVKSYEGESIMVEWTIQREYGTGIFKAECKERGIIITKNTYNEARAAMLEALGLSKGTSN